MDQRLLGSTIDERHGAVLPYALTLSGIKTGDRFYRVAFGGGRTPTLIGSGVFGTISEPRSNDSRLSISVELLHDGQPRVLRQAHELGLVDPQDSGILCFADINYIGSLSDFRPLRQKAAFPLPHLAR